MTDRDLTVVSWDGQSINDGTNYSAGFRPAAEWGLPSVSAQRVRRDGHWPLIGGLGRPGRNLDLIIVIQGSAVRTLRDQLALWFDPEDETPKKLIIEDEGGGGDRYVYAICEELRPVVSVGVGVLDVFMARLAVHDDVRWRSTSETSDGWNITASGQTNVVNNGGSDDAYPSFEITPTTNKSGGLAYKHFIPVVWLSANAATQYPVRLGPLDTATLTTAKMQADGDDLRVYLNGIEIDRWLVDMDTANTYIWVNLSFQPGASATLGTAIASSGGISSIDVGDTASDFPASGLVFIDDEVFSYTGRDLSAGTLTGITRAAKGSSMAAHTTSDTVYWLQHELILAYGNASLGSPDTDDDYEPAFNLAAADSSNTQWKYAIFGDGNNKRSGRWTNSGNITLAGTAGAYTATQRTLAAGDYTVIGGWISTLVGASRGWYLSNPCGITNMDWADGQKRAAVITDFLVHLMYWIRGDSWWTWQATLGDPSVADTWEAWSEAAGGAWSAADKVGIAAYYFPSDIEAGTVTVTLNSAETPVVDMSACAEQGNYPLVATITNSTTGEAITVTFDMELNETLILNTDLETVVYDADGSPQFQAVAVGTVRRHWLKLQPGNNTLQYDDTGTVAVTVDTKFEARYY